MMRYVEFLEMVLEEIRISMKESIWKPYWKPSLSLYAKRRFTGMSFKSSRVLKSHVLLQREEKFPRTSP